MKRIAPLIGLLAVFGAAAPGAADKTFVLKTSTRDLNEFRAFVKIASRLKAHGNVQVDIGVLADKSWYEMPQGGSPWHEYATTHGAMFKYFPHPKIAPFLPADFVKKNRELLLAKAAILRVAGLDAAFSSNDTHFLPEAFFRRYPHLRGPRVDHPRRSRHEEFSYCVDQPETLEMIEWMAAELKRNVPEIKSISSLNNDSGSGLCWSAALYSGPNGPAHCAGRHVGVRVRGLIEAIQRGFEKGGGKVVTRLYGNFWRGEDEIVLAHLPLDSYLSDRDRTSLSVGTLAVDAYPVLGLINPMALYASLERYDDPGVRTVFVHTGPYYDRFNEPPETVSKLIDLIEDYLAQPAGKGLAQRFDRLRKLAAKCAGERNADAAFEAFYGMNEAFRLKQTAAFRYSNLYCGVSMRHLTRPLLIRPDALSPEEEKYFLPHIFNVSGKEGRMDYTDLHGSPYAGPASWNDPGVRSALSTAVQAARGFESLPGAPQQDWLRQLGLSLRMWASEVRSIHNFYFAQQLRDRNREALAGPPKPPPKVSTWDGDRDFIEWTHILRDETDNAEELLALLGKGGLKFIGHTEDPKYEDTFLLGPRLEENLRRKVDLMRAHWLDVQLYLAPPHK